MPSLTRATLVTKIGDLIGDPNNTRWSASKKQDKIQEAQEKFVADTKALTDNATDTTVVGTREYSLPTDCFDIIRLALAGLPLRRLAKLDLDIIYAGSDWTEINGTPVYYYVDIDPNNLKYGLIPVPSAVKSIAFEYVKIPPTLSSDNSVPFDSNTLMTPYHMALAYYAAAYFLRADAKTAPNPQSWGIAIANFQKQYEDLVGECIDDFKHLANSDPFRMRGGRYFRDL